jgi:hypothetical protein
VIFLTLQLRRTNESVSASLWKEGKALTPEVHSTDLSAADLETLRTELTEGQKLTAEIPRFAKRLGGLLLPPALLQAWQEASKAVPAGTRLVTMLDLEATLQSYPWELAWAGGRLFFRPDRPFLRQAPSVKGSSDKPGWPIDMLIVLGSRKRELEEISGYEELHRIRKALRERNRFVHLHVLDLSAYDPQQPDATGRQRLSSALSRIRPQVLHFIGHGTDNGLELFQPGRPEEEDVGSAVWTKDAIAPDLKFTPWLVYLNACRSLGGGQALPLHFSTLAGAFLDEGVRAVIAMHADISGPRAAVCAERFYQALGAGDSIDVALTHARAEVDRSIVGAEAGIKEMAEAYLPALIVAGDPANVIPCFTDRYRPPKTARISTGNEIAKVVNELVNQDTMRRELLGWPLSESGHANAIAVHGPTNSGKSWLLAWCMDGWLRQQYTVSYNVMAKHRHWFEAMSAILLSDTALGLKSVAVDEARKLFIGEIGELLAPATAKGRKTHLTGLKPANRKRLDSEIAFVADCFARALKHAGATGPLVIILDQFEMPGITPMDPVTFKLLYNNWIQPYVIDNDSPVHVVLGLPRALADSYELPASLLKVSLDAFAGDRYVDLIDELLRARYAAEYQALHGRWQEEKQRMRPNPRLPADLSQDCNVLYHWLRHMR